MLLGYTGVNVAWYAFGKVSVAAVVASPDSSTFNGIQASKPEPLPADNSSNSFVNGCMPARSCLKLTECDGS